MLESPATDAGLSFLPFFHNIVLGYGEMKEASTMLNGTVKFFNSTKGFGFLTTPEGEDIFFHKSNVKDTGFRDELRQGDNVKFEIRVEQKGKRAYNIARVSSEVPKEKDMPSTL